MKRATIVTHGGCLDGLVSAMLLWNMLRSTHVVHIFYAAYQDARSRANMLNATRDAHAVYFCDFTPEVDGAPDVAMLAELVRARAPGRKVVLLDHHLGAHLDDAAVPQGVEYHYDAAHCAASLIAARMPESAEGLHARLVPLVRSFDLWQIEEDTFPFQIECIRVARGIAEYGSNVPAASMHLLVAALADVDGIVKRGRPLIAWHERLFRTDFPHRFTMRVPWSGGPTEIVCMWNGNTRDKSWVCHRLAEETGAPITAVIEPVWDEPVCRMSIRAQSGNLLPMVKELGIGGGHPAAVGTKLSLDTVFLWSGITAL